MSPPPLKPTNRYFPPGLRRVFWMPTTANYLAPSRAELNAGVDLTFEIAQSGMAGWSLAGSTVDVADLGSRFISTVPGRLTSPTNTLDLYLSQDDIDARTLLPRDTNGFIVICWAGDITGQKMDVFPVRVITQANDPNTEDPGKCTFEFAISRVPAIAITIP